MYVPLDQSRFPPLSALPHLALGEMYYIDLWPRESPYLELITGSVITYAALKGAWTAMTAATLMAQLRHHANVEQVAHALVSLRAITSDADWLDVIMPTSLLNDAVIIVPLGPIGDLIRDSIVTTIRVFEDKFPLDVLSQRAMVDSGRLI